jgi:glutaredoxin 3
MLRIYTKDYCPYCVKAKNLLDSIGAIYEEIDITSTPDLIIGLAKKSGMRTVPQIFIGDKCIGGYDDIHKLHKKGELMAKIQSSIEK